MNFIKNFFGAPSMKRSWYSLSGTLLFFLFLSLLEFGVLFAVKANSTFGNPFLQALPTFLLLVAIPLVIGGKAAKIYLFIVAYFSLLVEVMTALIAIRFKVRFDTDFVVVLSATSPAEIVEFIETYYSWGILIAVVVALLLSGVALFFAIRKCEFRRTWNLRVVGILLCIPFIISTTRYCIKGTSEKGLKRSNILRIATGSYEFYQQWETLADAIKNPKIPTFSRQIKADAPITGIIVFGESATRSHHALFGYDRPTTPELSKRDDLILFSDAISGWGSTTNALRLMLTYSTMSHPFDSRCSLVDVFKQAGYRVVVLSNQFRWGVYDGPITMLFMHADRIIFQQEKGRRKSFDDSLIPLLDEELRQAGNQPLIVFLHLIGSHDAPKQRYPSNFDPFHTNGANLTKIERQKNEYDTSIVFTDQVLGKIAERVAKKPTPTFMLYVSDHGSIYAEGKTRTSRSTDPEIYEVPMILQLNQAYRTDYPKIFAKAMKNAAAPIHTDCLFWTMASLAGLQGNDPLECNSPLSDNFQPPKERKIAEGTCVYLPQKGK